MGSNECLCKLDGDEILIGIGQETPEGISLNGDVCII